ncbi:MAG TPA: hypothetical protein VGO89_22705, partial [Streptomyces sp.]|nr:hypothetical protein [Streptomyces sp.]
PGILRRLDAEDALAVRDRQEEDASVEEFDNAKILRGLAHRERARRRRRFAGLAAACVLCVGLGAGATAATLGKDDAGGTEGTAPAAVAMKPMSSSGIKADISFVAKPWGTRLDWSCSYRKQDGASPSVSPAYRSYELVVTDQQGKQTVVATWKTSGGQTKHLAASSSYRADEIRSVDIRKAGSDQPLAGASL